MNDSSQLFTYFNAITSFLKKKLIVALPIMGISLVQTTYAQVEHIEAYYEKLEKQARKESVTIQFVQDEMQLVEDFSGLNQIILLRHGEPALSKKGWRKRKEAMQFVFQYDTVGVCSSEYAPIQLNPQEVNVIFTSTLQRSISTAQQLFPTFTNQQAKPIFKEFERKVFSFFNIKLPLRWWTTGSRVFWLMGLNKKGIESFSEAKKRAKKAASLLEIDATQNGKTLLVSHGLLNHYLVKYLEKSGWKEVFDGGKGYLSQKVLVRYQ